MTLCIAALCREEGLGAQRVVVGFDWRIETETDSAETEFKFEYLGDYWCALIAGPLRQARELTARYKVFLQAQEKSLTAFNVLDQLRQPVLEFRWSLADKYTRDKLAVSYDDFLNHGAAYFPDDLRRQVAYDITAQTVKAELILIGLVEKRFIVAECFNGDIELCGDFSTVGSGSAIARSALYHRQQNNLCSLPDTIYTVYEAKRLGEKAPGVGKITSVMVLRDYKGTLLHQPLSEEDLSILDRQFKKFGPRPIKRLSLPPGIALLEDVDDSKLLALVGHQWSQRDHRSQPPSPESSSASGES